MVSGHAQDVADLVGVVLAVLTLVLNMVDLPQDDLPLAVVDANRDYLRPTAMALAESLLQS